ncbi:MAG TPA: glycosyltransferase family 1 protein [Cyclobacteriaceae bacterium]|nr:glycosyltransferase family 1 protein [Cyclobacteriaceae bacterium]
MTEEPLPDLICFSHLRWNFVYQRPQHLMTRHSGRVFYFEEPVYSDHAHDWLHLSRPVGTDITIVTPNLSGTGSTSPVEQRLRNLLDRLMTDENIITYMTWYYTPMALKFTSHLRPILLVYDCMDELSNFKFAPPELRALEAELFQKADIVFTGGKHLYSVKKKFHSNIFAFPSSIDQGHFRQSRKNLPQPTHQASIARPRLGYYGVIDERLDIALVDSVARKRPDWQIILVGPVVKIDPASLPQRQNIHYLGQKTYEDLPYYLSGWDIAIMPFALNEATEFISPTKTPEYLCGGKRVISTAIVDVVNDYGADGLVDIVGNADEFIKKSEILLASRGYDQWLERVDKKLATLSWDRTWRSMASLIMSTRDHKFAPERPRLNKSSDQYSSYV